MSEELSIEVVEASGAYPEIARKYKAAMELTDEELDFLRLLRSCSAEGRQIVFKLLETYRSPALLKQTNAALAENR